MNEVAPEIYATLDSMSTVISGMSSFSAVKSLASLDAKWSALSNLIVKNYRSTSFDWSSTTNSNILKKLATPSTYPSCTINNFQ